MAPRRTVFVFAADDFARQNLLQLHDRTRRDLAGRRRVVVVSPLDGLALLRL